MKRKLLIAIPVVLVLLVAGVVLLVLYGTESATVQRWIAGQLSSVAGDYLNPRLSLGAVRYQYPLAAEVDDVRLVADDPAKPGATIDIFVAKRITLEMAEIPRPGRPLRIQTLILDHPEFRAVSVSPEDPSFIGFSHLLKGAPTAATESRAKLSEVFEIRLIQIVDGLIVYDPRLAGTKPMEIDQVNSRLDVQPPSDDGTGWYTMEMNLERKPIFSTHFTGRVNIDSMVLDVQPLNVTLKIGRDQDHYLPPQIQALLAEHEVSGDLVVEVTGQVHASDWRASSLKAQMELTGGNVAAGEYHLPVNRLQVLWTMADRAGALEKFNADLLGGWLEGTGKVTFNDTLDGRLDLTMTHIRIEQCLRSAAGVDGKYKGDLSAQVTWQGPLTDPLKQSQGSGTIRVADGRLGQIPILSALLSVVTKTMKAAGMGSNNPKDTADMAFTFQGNRINFNKIFVVTPMAALHGRGDIFFDKHMDMLFNAGPLEKIQSMMGQIGDFFGKMTDEVSAYTVTGMLGDPKVGVKVAPNL